ncbi:hypothetical protein M514_25427 [Trichuris suis]|uniref:Uncharacterized protein n=1 Tax=Trichuris suis TaxID=68888 RepID=A0A085MYX3_9BILA|nr:hypothetical protein M514_25427 [Trichuris suis]
MRLPINSRAMALRPCCHVLHPPSENQPLTALRLDPTAFTPDRFDIPQLAQSQFVFRPAHSHVQNTTQFPQILSASGDANDSPILLGSASDVKFTSCFGFAPFTQQVGGAFLNRLAGIALSSAFLSV